MPPAMEEKLFIFFATLFLLFSFLPGVHSAATFTFVNKCGFTVWPGILSNAGVAALSKTGFALRSGESEIIDAPTGWGGRFWGRTYCGSQGTNGQFLCATGDCGSGRLACDGAGAEPPVTLAEFTLEGADGKDFYDISLVDGFNLPMLVVPQGGSGVNCTTVGCLEDLNSGCPTQLRVTADESVRGGGPVACKSACDAFGSDQHCCSGAYATPATCKPSQFSQMFKRACPQAYSYAYDDQTSTFTCTGADYIIAFCPSPNTSLKSSSGEQTSLTDGNVNLPANSNMIYKGASEISAASALQTACSHVLAAAAAVWWWFSPL